MAEPETKVALQVEETHHPQHQCWNCGDMRATRFCRSCGKVQPPMPADYFSFFGLPRKLDLDEAALEREFYKFSRKLHPDVFARSAEREQEWSLELTSQLNDAYRTLRDPVSRSEYLLQLEGVEFEEQSKAATDKARASGEQKKQSVPPEMLEEVFELNMLLEEARANRKLGERDEDVAQQLQQMKASLEERMAALMTELHGAWSDWDALVARGLIGATDRERVLGKMLDVLNRRSYIRNLVRDVNEEI